MVGMHHPWRELRNRGDGVRLFFTEFEDGRVAATHGTHIYLDRRLRYEERRTAIQHEQVHIEDGHTHCQDEAAEARVRRITARRLLTTSQLAYVLPWAHSLDEAAYELCVTPEVLMDFIHTLSPIERALIECAVRAKEA